MTGSVSSYCCLHLDERDELDPHSSDCLNEMKNVFAGGDKDAQAIARRTTTQQQDSFLN